MYRTPNVNSRSVFSRTLPLLPLLLFVLLLGLATTTSLPAQVAEICDNGIDDDADRLIDCADDDCFFPLYSDSGQGLGNSDSLGVALGDFDGDGDLDAWVANLNQANRVWINQGGEQGGVVGNFTDSGQGFGSSNYNDASLGDLDGDGDLDAWVANYNQPNRVWINQGGVQGGLVGNFADSFQELGNFLSRAVSLGDLDGDGDLDAWVANLNQANRVWINQGGEQGGVVGNFTDSGQALGNSTSLDVSLGDLDGDGDLDAWVANLNQANRVWINQGGVQGGTVGNFTDSGQALGNAAGRAVSLGDFDGDGDLDAWVANSDNQANRVWINQGGVQGGTVGNFTDSGQPLGNSISIDVSLGDLDGDGDLDAWVANSDNQANRVWLNQGGVQGGTAGNFTDSGQPLGSWDSRDVALGDLDGDGDLDAWVANYYGQPNRVYMNLSSCINDDLDGDGIPNACDIDQTAGADCDADGQDDSCQADSDSDGTIDPCDDDIDGDGFPNACDIDQTAGADCDADGQDDSCQIDTDSDGTIDPCDDDIDGDGIPNACDIDQTAGNDCDADGQDDSCQTDTDSDGTIDPCDNDIDGDGFPNACDIDQTAGADCDADGQDDSCQIDTDSDGTIDPCDDDIDGDGFPNACDIDQTAGPDCDADGQDDSCQIDTDSDGTIDPCDDDIDGDGIPNACDIDQTAGADCNSDGQDDSCQTDTDSDGTIDPCDDDIDGDGIPNGCDIDQTAGADCDADGQDDSCQIDTDSDGTIDPCDDDIDGDGIPNACDIEQTPGDDCNGNSILDSCDIAGGAADADGNGIPDECEETPFIRGDANADGGIYIGDAVATLAYLFTGGTLPCDNAADSNDDGLLDIADAIALLGYLFNGAPPPPPPFPDCGIDPTVDALECESFAACP
jgi:hypothetical protein